MAKLTQGTHVYIIDPDTNAPLKIDCATALTPGGSAAEQIEVTCLEETEERQYEAGIGAPAAGSISIDPDGKKFPSHARLFELSQGSRPTLEWAVGWSGSTTLPRAGASVGPITVTDGGSGYTTPTVTLSAPDDVDGTQATAEAVVSGGEIIAINVLEPGSGYDSAPTVTIGGAGTGATATASLGSFKFILPNTRTWLKYRAYISDFPFDFALNSVVKADIAFQRSGKLDWVQEA